MKERDAQYQKTISELREMHHMTLLNRQNTNSQVNDYLGYLIDSGKYYLHVLTQQKINLQNLFQLIFYHQRILKINLQHSKNDNGGITITYTKNNQVFKFDMNIINSFILNFNEDKLYKLYGLGPDKLSQIKILILIGNKICDFKLEELALFIHQKMKNLVFLSLRHNLIQTINKPIIQNLKNLLLVDFGDEKTHNLFTFTSKKIIEQFMKSHHHQPVVIIPQDISIPKDISKKF